MRAFLLTCAMITAPAWAANDFAYTQKVGAGETAIDTRSLADCKQATLPGARCLPVVDFLSPQKQLPSERDLLWLLGTAGLDGSEAVLVVGDSESARDFVAGLLYLSGQRRVSVLTMPLTPLLAKRPDAAPGPERGIVRSAIWTTPMRDHLWLVDRREIGSDASILAADAYTAILRFTRHMTAGGQPVRVGWNLSSGSSAR
jgi:thiosulfate/3-mercaptopyruvate sulfurtransferase